MSGRCKADPRGQVAVVMAEPHGPSVSFINTRGGQTTHGAALTLSMRIALRVWAERRTGEELTWPRAMWVQPNPNGQWVPA